MVATLLAVETVPEPPLDSADGEQRIATRDVHIDSSVRYRKRGTAAQCRHSFRG